MCGYNTQLELNRIKSPSFCVFPVLGIVLPAFLIAVKKQIKGERVYFASYFMGMQSNKVRKTWYQEHKAIGHLTSMKRRGKSVGLMPFALSPFICVRSPVHKIEPYFQDWCSIAQLKLSRSILTDTSSWCILGDLTSSKADHGGLTIAGAYHLLRSSSVVFLLSILSRACGFAIC